MNKKPEWYNEEVFDSMWEYLNDYGDMASASYEIEEDKIIFKIVDFDSEVYTTIMTTKEQWDEFAESSRLFLGV